MREKLLFALACVLLILLAAGLASCTPAAPITATPTLPTTSPTQAPPEAVTPEPAQVPNDDWANIQKAGVIRVASPLDNPPFNMRNEKFEPDGFDIALITELANRLGLKVEVSDYAFDGMLAALDRREVDAAIAAMAITPDRRQLADFTQAYYQGEDAVLAAPNSPIAAITDQSQLANHKVGVQRGTVYESWIKKNLIDTGQMATANLMVYSQPADAIGALNAGAVDLVVLDRVPGLDYEAQGKAKVVGKSTYVQDFGIAVPKGSGLREQLNRALTKVAVDGTLARLAETYLKIPAADVTPVPTEAPTEAPSAEPTATFTPQVTATPAPYNNWGASGAVDINVPDNTPMKPGQAFKKGWHVKNTGTITWSPDYRIVYTDGDPTIPASQMGGLPTKIGVEVPPGATHDIYVSLVAPTQPGTYRGNWELEDAAGNGFGQQLWVQIVVLAPTPVNPPTFTPVPGITFSYNVNPPSVQQGASTLISWNVTGVVRGVYFCLQPNQQCQGVGQQDQRQVQPPYAPTTVYELRVDKTDGSQTVYQMPVNVTQAPDQPRIQGFSANAAGECADLWWQVSDNPRRVAIARIGGGPAVDGASTTGSAHDCPGVTGSLTYELQVWAQGSNDSQPPIDRRQQTVYLQGQPPKTVEVHQDQCFTGVSMRTGDTFRVVLTAPGGTGYVWDQSDIDQSILSPLGSNVQEATAPGGPQTYIWQYVATRGGQTTPTYILHRGDDVSNTCNFGVNVQ